MLPNTRVLQMKQLSNQNVCFPRTLHYFALLSCFPFIGQSHVWVFSSFFHPSKDAFEGQLRPDPKAPPNAPQKQGLLFSLFGGCCPSRPPISQDSLCARKNKNKRKHLVP